MNKCDAHVLSRLMVATEEIVLASERDGTDLVLGKIVVKQKPSVIEPKAQDDFRNIFIRIIDFYSRTNRSTFAKKMENNGNNHLTKVKCIQYIKKT